MKTYFVVASVIMHKGKILILKKSKDDWNYPNCWSFCSGFVKEFESGEDTAEREIKEETGLKAKLTRKGKIFEAADKRNKKTWAIMPFLFKTNSSKVKLCNENSEYKWIKIKELKNYKSVPGLEKDLKALGLI